MLADNLETDERSDPFVLQQGRTFMLGPGNSDTKVGRGIIVANQFSVANKQIKISNIFQSN